MPELDWAMAITLLIVVAAGVVVGLAGFGFALFAVPPLLFMHEPSTVVLLVNFLGFTSGMVVLYGEFREVRTPVLRALLPWALPGLLGGLGILHVANGQVIKLFASVVIIVFALLAAFGVTIPGVHRPGATRVAGLTSGLLGTSAGLPGPPIALLFTAQEMPPTAFRVTITSYFMVIDLVAVALLLISGLVTRADLTLAVVLVPASLVGRWIGRKLADKLTARSFRLIVIALLIVTGLLGAVGAIVSLT